MGASFRPFHAKQELAPMGRSYNRGLTVTLLTQGMSRETHD
jgi:hypothetical protein